MTSVRGIPKRIMQTWKNTEIPASWKPSVESIRRYMPNWEWTLMTDADNRAFIERWMPDFLSYYDAFPYPIQRADAIRYVYLYVNGGIYMDLDILVQKPLDDLFPPIEARNQLYLVSSGNFGPCITNSFMASTPKHPIWLDVIEEMKRPVPFWALTKHFIVMTSTGPMMLDRVIKRGKYSYMSLPSQALTPCSVCVKTCVAPQAYTVALNSGSWNSFDSTALNWILCNWKPVLWVFLLLFLLLLLCLFFFFYTRHTT